MLDSVVSTLKGLGKRSRATPAGAAESSPSAKDRVGGAAAAGDAPGSLVESADGTPRKEHDLVFWEDDAFDDDHIALKWGSVSTLQLPSASTAQRSLRALHKPERKRERERERERERP